ncbi:adenosine-deaminase domain-containing protein [Phaeosphaeriaceae sp. PMI808]|nr:adenosine-deaminase domain-containing protein [Phaeosphaeriaceae sp. PMI808]
MVSIDPDAVADCVLATFHHLPEKRKPRSRNDGSTEWVPLAGIVLSKGRSSLHFGKFNLQPWLIPVIQTGMKCLPSSKLPLARGNVLHDWHAEVLAIRAFNRFLLDQCYLTCTPPYPASDWVCRRSSDDRSELPFAIREHVQIYMYCSEAPCGDASMELVMDAQDDATPWTSTPPTLSLPAQDTETKDSVNSSSENPEAMSVTNPSALRGRSNFSYLGFVRCKPSRLDAPPTLSKSCTDKLTRKQATSLLSSTTSLLISPSNAYLHTLIIPSSQHVPAACVRAFSRSGRIHLSDDTISSWKGGYIWTPFVVRSTAREFTWSRCCVRGNEKAIGSNLSAVWTPSWQETLIGGVLQGRKQLDPRGTSAICRRNMWKTAVQVAGILGVPALVHVLKKGRYADLKLDQVFDHRRKTKEDLKKGGLEGWVRNIGDDEFGLEGV